MDTSNAIISSAMFQIGDQIDQFQITDHIAQGGMSNIYRAFDLIKKCEVVIKIPEKSMMGDPAQFERFQREIEVSRILNHPAVLRGICTGNYNRIPYLVTEMVKGQTLRQFLNSSAPLPVEHTFSLVRKIADGMAYCHQNNVVHRDLKPENILLNQDGDPVIMDFGLALTKSSHRVTYSNLSITMGTPDYMAPEQVEGQRGDARSDIYALGIIMFEMLCGNTPFTGDSNLAILAQRIHCDAPRLDKIRADLSPQIAAIVAKCLQRDPNARFQDMGSLIEAIDHPESMDISLLDSIKSSQDKHSIWKSALVRNILVSLLILASLVVLALTLQYFR